MSLRVELGKDERSRLQHTPAFWALHSLTVLLIILKCPQDLSPSPMPRISSSPGPLLSPAWTIAKASSLFSPLLGCSHSHPSSHHLGVSTLTLSSHGATLPILKILQTHGFNKKVKVVGYSSSLEPDPCLSLHLYTHTHLTR